MSKFFARSDSESESSCSEAEELPKAAVASKVYQVSDEEEETKRVVRSAKDKRFTDLQNTIKVMRNHKKIKDITNVLDDYESLVKQFDKAKKVVEREGCPRFYVRCVAELEDFANSCWEDRDERKKMSKHNAKSLTTLRQKIRKYVKDHFEEKVTAYRQTPDVGDDLDSGADEDEDDDDEDEDEDDFFKKKAEPEQKPAVDSDDDDDDSWGDDLDSETSSDEEEGRIPGQLTADFFRKKVVSAEEEAEKLRKVEEKKAKKALEKLKKDEGQEDGDEWTHVGTPQPQVKEKPKMFAKDTEITHEAVIKKMFEMTAGRGKKGTDRQEQIELLHELRGIAKDKDLGDALDTKIMFAILAAVYDYNPNIATSMKTELWEKCMEHVREILDLLVTKGDEFIVGANISEDSENFEGPPPYRVRGCILMAVERMDEEYTKMLQACDAHSTEYVDRLRDELTVCKIIEDLEKYLEGHATTEEICRIYMKRINHLYYKFDHRLKQGNASVESQNTMDKLCKYIYAKDNTDRIRTCAILTHIYHHALHDRWFEARDLMLMSHLQDTIQYSDIPTQILYNRAMVQLGLCAFRQGMIKDAHSCLVDIQSSGRAKELLAQGLSPQRQHERTPEQEKIEKRRQMPYHMHINLELLECVYLVSAMLIEIPYMAAHEFDARRRMISKNFHYVLRVSDRQTLVGPPESMREHVVAASKAMKKGDWKSCRDYLINEKMNAKVWDLFYDADRVRELIQNKVQEESLRTYLFAYSSVYDSISMATIADMFELEQPVVMSITSKMIINQELMASVDEPTKTLGMHRTEPTRLQSLALQLSEKVSSLVDYNERLLEMKQGNFFPFQRGQGRQDGNYRDRGDRNDGYGRGRDDNRRGGRDNDNRRGGGGGGYNRNRDQGGGRGGGGGGYNRNRDQGDRRGGHHDRY